MIISGLEPEVRCLNSRSPDFDDARAVIFGGYEAEEFQTGCSQAADAEIRAF